MEMKIIYLRLKPCTMEQKGTINVTGTTDLLQTVNRDVAHNHHNYCSSLQGFLRLMAIAIAEAPTPNFLAISAIEIPISRFKKHAISALAFAAFRLWFPFLTSSSLTLDFLHIRAMTFSIDFLPLFRTCRAIASSASRVTA